MTRYEYISVHEWTSGPKEGDRFLKFGKGEEEGVDIQLGTPNNDVEFMRKMERERVLLHELPEPFTKEEVKVWFDSVKPDEVVEALEVGEVTFDGE